jgi:hypothetical protein
MTSIQAKYSTMARLAKLLVLCFVAIAVATARLPLVQANKKGHKHVGSAGVVIGWVGGQLPPPSHSGGPSAPHDDYDGCDVPYGRRPGK